MPRPQPDPRVIAIINHALDAGGFDAFAQVALIRCMSAVFSDTEWWRDMLRHDRGIRSIVDVAIRQTMH